MDMQEIKRRNEEFAPVPDIVFLLELEPDLAIKRITRSRGESLNNFEKEEYLRRVAENFDAMHDDFIVRLDAASPREELLENAMKYIDPLL
jgi:dTMP kinase